MPSLRSTRVVFPDGIRPATLWHERGVIMDIGEGSADDDFGDLVVLPGLVDTHVHVNEPGRTEWEGFASATRAAAAGGATTIVDMPLNSIPPTVDVDALDLKRTAASHQVSVDVAFWGGVIPESTGHLPGLIEAGVCGFKVFLVDSGVPEFPPIQAESLDDIANALATGGVPMLAHAEDPDLLTEMAGDRRSHHSYLASRPVESEVAAVRAVSAVAGRTGVRTHILHVSSAGAVAAIAHGPANLSGETCPHYLTFDGEDIPDGATEFKCAPPIRGRDHREELWAALSDGRISMVVSDHSPAPPELKALDTGDFATAWGGIASLQLRLAATWTGASQRGMGLEDLAGWLAANPAELAGLHRKGTIETGKDADFVIFDPEAGTVVDAQSLEHRHRLTPYHGMNLRGAVVATILRGQTVYEPSSLPGAHLGRLLRRDD